ncbi:MAG: phosphoribosyltransferase-like protein [Betaproteobacteria bacterium]
MTTAKQKEAFRRISELCEKFDWLQEKEAELGSLLAECSNTAQVELIHQLITRFQFLHAEDIENCFKKVADQIASGWALPEAETQVVAMSFDDEPDSGQLVLQILKPIFARKKWKPRLTITVPRALKYLRERANLILVDEFSGTGRTVTNRITYIRNEAASRGAPVPEIRVCLFAAIEEAISTILAQGVECFVVHPLKKGISGYLDGEEAEAAKHTMRSLETTLAPVIRGEPLPSLGYGGAEALYGAESYNAPNSVFPVFWWPQSRNGSERDTLLSRF